MHKQSWEWLGYLRYESSGEDVQYGEISDEIILANDFIHVLLLSMP